MRSSAGTPAVFGWRCLPDPLTQHRPRSLISTPRAIEVSAHALARYAALCQEAELVPIVELEVLMDGEHTLAQCREATEEVLQTVFHLIEKLRAPDGNVALFSHGHFGCVLAARWIGSPLIEAQHSTLGTASLGILGRDTATPRCRSSLCGIRLHAQT